MKIILNKNKPFNIPLYNNLMSLSDKIIYSDEHSPSLSHPADIYRECINDINSSLNNMIKQIENKYILYGTNSNSDLKNSLKNYIQNIDTFYENLYNIIKTLKKPNNKVNINPHEWLKENNHSEGNNLSGRISKVHELIRVINNHFKHSTILIRTIKMSQDNQEIYGFCLENSDSQGKTTPNQKIHKQYQGMETGISFNFFIKITITLIFFYSEQLNKVLFENKNSKVLFKVKNDKASIEKFIPLYKLAEIGYKTATFFLPNEYDEKIGIFKKSEDNIIIEYPRKSQFKLKKEGHITQIIPINPRNNKGVSKILYLKNNG